MINKHIKEVQGLFQQCVALDPLQVHPYENKRKFRNRTIQTADEDAERSIWPLWTTVWLFFKKLNQSHSELHT